VSRTGADVILGLTGTLFVSPENSVSTPILSPFRSAFTVGRPCAHNGHQITGGGSRHFQLVTQPGHYPDPPDANICLNHYNQDEFLEKEPWPMAKRMPKLSAAARKLLELIPPDGEFIGNTNLLRRSKLGDRYWKVRDELIGEGFLTRGKGRGGSVARFAADVQAPSIDGKRAKQHVAKESELYAPLKEWLDTVWGADITGGEFFEVCITASPKGKRRSGGKWSRPDVTLVQVNNYDYLAQPVLEVTTFEVKKFADAEDIRSIYETAAHSRWAHFSYLVVEVPDGEYEFPERFMAELERFNLGLIFMWKERSGWQFDEQEWETDRLNPDPTELNALLTTFFKSSKREREYKLAIGK
jgi:hypothetical protein